MSRSRQSGFSQASIRVSPEPEAVKSSQGSGGGGGRQWTITACGQSGQGPMRESDDSVGMASALANVIPESPPTNSIAASKPTADRTRTCRTMDRSCRSGRFVMFRQEASNS